MRKLIPRRRQVAKTNAFQDITSTTCALLATFRVVDVDNCMFLSL